MSKAKTFKANDFAEDPFRSSRASQSTNSSARADEEELRPMSQKAKAAQKVAPVAVGDRSLAIDSENARFPFCIVWTPLPLISWLLPFIGHTGVATSHGIIHDFAGPYTVSIDDLAFGETHKYIRILTVPFIGMCSCK